MFLVEIVAVLGGARPLDDEEITDLVEAVVDDLDRQPLEPSVGTERVGGDVRITVGVTVDVGEEWDALGRAVEAVKAAFGVAGIGVSGVVAPRELSSHVTPFRAA